MSDEDVQAELERLKKENEALKAQAKAKPGQFSLKVSQKGAVSVYGMGRFPVDRDRAVGARVHGVVGGFSPWSVLRGHA